MTIGKTLEWIEETLIAYLLGAMVALAFVNAVLRRIFNSGFFWSLETILLMFLILVLFGMAYAARKSLHIGVDAVVNLFDVQKRRIITLIAGLLSIVYAFCMVYASYSVFAKYYSNPFLQRVQLEDIPVPIYVVYFLLICFFAYFGFTLMYMTYQVWSYRRTSITSAHEASEQEAEVSIPLVIENSSQKN